MKKKNIVDIVINIIIILLAILVIYWLIELIFGGSPGISEFNFAVIILIAGFLFKMYREVGEIKVEMKYSFKKMKEDMSLIKKSLQIQ